jgi:Domain of unknown function (DUF4259)
MSVLETGNFGNDEATDWLYDLEETYGSEMLSEAFDVIAKGEFHELADCCIALAAAEVVAAAKGKPASDLPDDARKWLGNQETSDVSKIKALNKKAITAVKKIQAHSELRDQWEDTDEWHSWTMVVERLLKRLQ